MVPPAGIEPATPGLGIDLSINQQSGSWSGYLLNILNLNYNLHFHYFYMVAYFLCIRIYSATNLLHFYYSRK